MNTKLKRIAYIIANNRYTYIENLNGTENDANLMEEKLKKCDFDVKKHIDLSYQEFIRQVSNFKNQCEEYDVGLFYFSGHGFEFEGENYLCATNFNDEDIKKSSVNITNLVNEISENRNFVSIIILDCCRNVYVKKTRQISALKDIIPNFKNHGGTFVAYATTSGKSAVESGGYGMYTKSLCKHLLEEKPIEEIFKNVRKDIIKQTEKSEHTQIPWEYSSLVDEFYFYKKNKPLKLEEILKKILNKKMTFLDIKQEVKDYCLNNMAESKYNDVLLEVLRKIDDEIGEV